MKSRQIRNRKNKRDKKKPIHTEGPWELSEGFIRGADGIMRSIHIKVLGNHDDVANACLVASGPWLLEALEVLLEDHKRMFSEAHPYSAIKWEDCFEVCVARAAIAKATGGEE